jgi:RimJ/RimL family protein N-acetyltransferase
VIEPIELRRAHLIGLVTPDNIRSIRVAERLGERLEGEVTEPPGTPTGAGAFRGPQREGCRNWRVITI